jgi:hypothetical protein
MTKQLEKLLNVESAQSVEIISTDELKQTLNEFEKISENLPTVDGMQNLGDVELDHLANKAEKAFEDLMDLGMNVDSRYSTKMFEVAGTMLATAVTAKSSKIDKKLKIIELQLKKLAIDKKYVIDESSEVQGEGFILSDRNSILNKIKNIKNG